MYCMHTCVCVRLAVVGFFPSILRFDPCIVQWSTVRSSTTYENRFQHNTWQSCTWPVRMTRVWRVNWMSSIVPPSAAVDNCHCQRELPRDVNTHPIKFFFFFLWGGRGRRTGTGNAGTTTYPASCTQPQVNSSSDFTQYVTSGLPDCQQAPGRWQELWLHSTNRREKGLAD